MANKDKKIEINPGMLAKIESEKNFFIEFISLLASFFDKNNILHF